jgi:hypothetical protein
MLYLLELIKRNKTAFWIAAGVILLLTLNLVLGNSYVKRVEEKTSKERDAFYAEVIEKNRIETANMFNFMQKEHNEEKRVLVSSIEELSKKISKLESEKSSKTETRIVTRERIVMPDGTIIEKEESKDVSEIIQTKLSQLEEESTRKLQTQIIEVETKYQNIIKITEENHRREIAELKNTFKSEKEILLSEITKETIPVGRLFVSGGMNLDKNILSSVYVKVFGNIFLGVSTEFNKTGFKDVGLNIGVKF